MLSGTIAYLVELNSLIQLLTETLPGSTVRGMEGGIVSICAPSPAHLAVAVRTGKARIQNNLLKALAIFPFEISHKGIVSLPVRESVIFVTHS